MMVLKKNLNKLYHGLVRNIKMNHSNIEASNLTYRISFNKHRIQKILLEKKNQ